MYCSLKKIGYVSSFMLCVLFEVKNIDELFINYKHKLCIIGFEGKHWDCENS